MTEFLGGVDCEWFSAFDERTYLLPHVDSNSYLASVSFARVRVERNTATLISRSPEVTYRYPEDAVVETLHGCWPAPIDTIAALARGEVSGMSKARFVYSVYWQALSRSPDFRKWVAEQYPRYWKSLVLSFPAMETA